MTSNKYDFLIIGGGIIGVNIALTLKKRHPDSSVCVVDKEAQLGLHASGRNSGVIHAGFYYSANSLKARFTRDGNRSLRRFIQEHKDSKTATVYRMLHSRTLINTLLVILFFYLVYVLIFDIISG